MNLIYIIYVLFFLWLIHIIQRLFYSIYFWQIKEYRFDRVKGDIKKSLKVFFPKTSVLSFIILLLLPLFLFQKNIYIWNIFVLLFFCLIGIYSIFLLYKRKWKLPKLTKKAIFLLILNFIFLILCLGTFINVFFLFIIITEILLASATFLITEIIQIPTFFIKRKIYQIAEKKVNNMKDLTVIGITGSYGKSSTKEFLYTILSKKYKVLKTSGNTNTEIGVAKTIIKELKPEHQILIVEMGAYRKKEIELLCKIVKPKIGIVTGVNEQHLALFGSLENLLSAEGGKELADSLPKDGLLILNGNNKYCIDLYKNFNGKKKIYSEKNKIINSDIWPDNITVCTDHVSFVAIDKDGEMMHFNINFLGKHNIQNILGAILIAKELGMNLEEISKTCKDISQNQGGITFKKGKHNINIIDSSYSANPDGVFADLEYISIYPNKKVIIMPCLIELGEKSLEIHEKIGKKIAQVCDLAIITTKDEFKEIKSGAISAGMKEKNIILCDNSEDIYSAITLFCKSGDTVLLEGRVPKELINLLL